MTKEYSYFDKLVDLGGGEKQLILFRKLYNTDFYDVIPMDINRAKDGLILRDEWEWDNHETCEKQGACSVLEMLIALARRYIFVSGQAILLKDVVQLFLDNLGLGGCRDDVFGLDTEKEIDQKVRRFLDRKYTKMGHGSLFPLKKRINKDLRDEEIWYQMNYYLIEKYDL